LENLAAEQMELLEMGWVELLRSFELLFEEREEMSELEWMELVVTWAVE
jgi:hypothetical protein